MKKKPAVASSGRKLPGRSDSPDHSSPPEPKQLVFPFIVYFVGDCSEGELDEARRWANRYTGRGES
jgi:hypothetical protein